MVRPRMGARRHRARKSEATMVVWEYEPELAQAMSAQYAVTKSCNAEGMCPPHAVRQLLHEKHGVHPSKSILASVYLCDFAPTDAKRMQTLESGLLPRGVVIF